MAAVEAVDSGGARMRQGAVTSETRADHGAGDRKEPQPPTHLADGDACAGKSSEGQSDEDEICGICLDVFDNPVQLSCGHSFCEVCLDGWHIKSKYDVHQPRNCPMCRHRAKPSEETISKLYAISAVISSSSEDSEDGEKVRAMMKKEQEELSGALFTMGHTNEDIETMLQEYRDSQNLLSDVIARAVDNNDAQTVLDWLGSPIDEGKLTSEEMGGLTMLYSTSILGHKELTSLLLQYGAAVNAYDSLGGTPILHALLHNHVLANETAMETAMLMYEWGASLEHHIPGEQGAAADVVLSKLPMFHNELVKRRCEIVNLDQRKDLIGQTCIVEKYIAKKDRYKVTTEHAHETFLVGPDNLKRRDRTPDDPGYYVTFQDGEYKRHTFASNEECQEFVSNLKSGQAAD